MSLDPIVLFFALGVAAGLARSELRLPEALYQTLSLYLLISIGLKGGVELASQPISRIAPQALGVITMGVVLTFVAYGLLRLRFAVADAASIAAHYGSVSVGTFAVALAYVHSVGLHAEDHAALFVVLLEMPAVMLGIWLARRGKPDLDLGELLHEVFLGKSMVLLAGGLAIGWLSGAEALKPLNPVFVVPFKGALALFLLEMGVVAASRVADLRHAGLFLLGFGLGMPLLGALIGIGCAWLIGLSAGGAVLLAALAASASYIAAPAAMRIAVPEANPTLSLTASLGITFPFNVLLGVPLYHQLVLRIYG